jgi:hypothetical protein
VTDCPTTAGLADEERVVVLSKGGVDTDVLPEDPSKFASPV